MLRVVVYWLLENASVAVTKYTFSYSKLSLGVPRYYSLLSVCHCYSLFVLVISSENEQIVMNNEHVFHNDKSS